MPRYRINIGIALIFLTAISASAQQQHTVPVRKKRPVRASRAPSREARDSAPAWPTPPAPLPGSILPAQRIVAFYGNPLSRRMGVLAEKPLDSMLTRLDREVAAWNAADP